MQKTNIRLLKKTLKIFGLGCAALLLIAVGLALWLRSSSGAAFVEARLASTLAGQGLTLTASRFSGPLPGRLLIEDLSLADHDGPMIKAASVEVELAPLALVRGLLHIPLIRITEPELIRLPAAAEDQPDQPSGPFSLPVAVRLDELAVSGGRMHEGALASLGLDTPALTLDVGGSGLVDKSQTRLDFKAEVADDQGREVLGALIKLIGGADGGPDQLDLAVTVDDRPGGLLSRVLDDPQWAGLNLSLTGQGPLTGWNGRLALSAENLLKIDADFNYAGQSGNLWADLVHRPGWRTSLQAKAVPGDGLPPELAARLGREADLNLSGALSGDELTADLSIKADGAPPISLEAGAAGTVAAGSGNFKVSAQILGLLPPTADGDADADPALHIKADLSLDKNGRKIDDLTVSGEGLELSANLAQSAESAAVLGQAALKVADSSPWVAAGLELAGLPPDYFGGDLDLTGDLNWHGLQEPVSGRLALQGRNLRWPTETLGALFGPSLTFSADLSGGGDRPIEADIKEAGAGQFSLSGRASFSQAEPLGQSEFTADLTANVQDLAVLGPDLGGPATLSLKGDGRLDDLKADLVLSSPQIITAQGALTGPTVGLSLSGALPVAADAQSDLSGRLDLTVDDSPGGPLSLSADWSFQHKDDESRAELANLSGSLAGLDLAGALTAVLRPERTSLTGELKADVFGWEKLAALTGQPLSGSPAHLALTFEAPEERQTVKADLDIPALRLGGGSDQLLALNRASLTLLADDLFGGLNLDLALEMGNGLAGPFSWGSGTVKASGRGGSGDFEAALDRARLAGSGGSAGDGLKMSGDFDLSSSFFGLKQFDFRLAGGGLRLSAPVRIDLAENLRISPLNLAVLPQGQMTAEIDLTPGAMRIKANAKSVPYSVLRSFGIEAPDGTVNSLDVDLLQGTAGLTGGFSLKTQLAAKELRGLKPSLELTGQLSGGPSPALNVEGSIDGGKGWNASGKLTARAPLSPGADGGFPTLNMNGPLSGQVTFTGPVRPVWNLLGQPDRILTGMLKIQAEVTGTPASPQPRGTAYLAGGRYTDPILGLLVSDINLEAHSTAEAALTALLAAKDQHGGGIALEAKIADLSKPSLTAKGRLSRFNPLQRDDLSAFISGDLAAEGSLDRLTLSSNLTVDRGELDLKIIQAAGSIPTLEISEGASADQAAGRQPGHRLALKINVPNQFFIRGFGLDSEWRGTLNINGSTNRPSLVGTLSPVRGYFEIFSKEFQFSSGDIAFNGGTNPSLNLELTNNGPNITAILKVGGNARKPQLSLESRPALPQEEVLSQVLFGKSASSISRFEALQLASALNELRNFGQSGGFNAIGFMRESLGLDVLRLGGTDNDRERRASNLTGSMGQELSGGTGGAGGGASDDISVEAGKYISDNVYVGVEHSPSGGSAVRMEVELRPNISLEARTSTESSRIGLGWKKDY